jgi:hypothetical protein
LIVVVNGVIINTRLILIFFTLEISNDSNIAFLTYIESRNFDNVLVLVLFFYSYIMMHWTTVVHHRSFHSQMTYEQLAEPAADRMTFERIGWLLWLWLYFYYHVQYVIRYNLHTCERNRALYGIIL